MECTNCNKGGQEILDSVVTAPKQVAAFPILNRKYEICLMFMTPQQELTGMHQQLDAAAGSFYSIYTVVSVRIHFHPC